jgi:hypothetical protein
LPGERLAPAKRACRFCGHWSNSPEFGMDISTGYCEVWEKLTSKDFVCDQFVEREQLKRDQAALIGEGDEDDFED